MDPRKQHRSRRKIPVTELASKRHPRERLVEMYVSPQLKVGTSLVEITDRAMSEARDNLEPLYAFVAEQSSVGVVAESGCGTSSAS